MKPFISTAFYGVVNYIIALTLISSPWLFGLVDVSSAALIIPIYIGWLQLVMAIFSDNETGFIKQFPMQIHLVMDVVMGFLVAISPFLYSFAYKQDCTAWIPAVVIGCLLMFMGNFTKKSPWLTPLHPATKQGDLESTDSIEGRLSI